MTHVPLELFPELEREVRSFGTGILPSQEIRALITAGYVEAAEPIPEEQIQPASLDLRLGPRAYRVQASFLPGRYSTVLKKLSSFAMVELDLTHPTVLERGGVYIVPLMESLRLPGPISGNANPKSTTGRLDIFTRLITDYGEEFERVPEGYRGPLYAEVVPRTFSIVVRPGMRLSQLRFTKGNPPSRDTDLTNLDKEETLTFTDEDSPAAAEIERGLKLSVNLKESGSRPIVAYRAKRNTPLIDLARVGFYDASDFWEALSADDTDGRLILNPGDFYILSSAEKVRVPPRFAAEMVPFDPSVGEFRIHYAGFFDPGFGYGASDIRGTRAVLEVRAHEVPFFIEDGQTVGRLIYTRLTDRPDKIYGREIGSSYQKQELALAKHFREFGSARARRVG